MIHTLLKLERPLIVLDVETTGIHANVDRILQLGIIKITPDGTVTEWQTLFNPGCPIPKAASDVHHITDEMVANQHPFSHYARGLLKGFSDCDFAGYNVQFDLGFLAAEFDRCGLEFIPTNIVDAFKIFQFYEPRNLTAAVSKYLGETEFSEAHDAMADTKMTLRVLEAQLKIYTDLPRSVPELHAMFSKPAPGLLDVRGKFMWKGEEAAINFGKHAGTLLRNVPRPYLEWMASPAYTADDVVKKIVRDALQGIFPKKGAA